MNNDKKKQVIGLYGEMQLAMKLHGNNWQVHRSYIDEGIDFVISKYYCKSCKKFSKQLIRQELYKDKKVKCVTNLCELCQKEKLSIVTKYLQVKTSEGEETNDKDTRDFSFHPKIRYDMDSKVYYVWIAVFENKELENTKIHYYIFHSSSISEFDDISLPSYQTTYNQKTTLKININGDVLNKGKKHNYRCFREFYNNFQILESLD